MMMSLPASRLTWFRPSSAKLVDRCRSLNSWKYSLSEVRNRSNTLPTIFGQRIEALFQLSTALLFGGLGEGLGCGLGGLLNVPPCKKEVIPIHTAALEDGHKTSCSYPNTTSAPLFDGGPDSALLFRCATRGLRRQPILQF